MTDETRATIQAMLQAGATLDEVWQWLGGDPNEPLYPRLHAIEGWNHTPWEQRPFYERQAASRRAGTALAAVRAKECDYV